MLDELGTAGVAEEELSAFFKTSSADSMSEVQENSNPTATTGNAKPKNLFINDLQCENPSVGADLRVCPSAVTFALCRVCA
jgi:hypothetical protein